MSLITLDHVSKRYRLRQLGSRSLREEVAQLAGRFLPGAKGEEHVSDFYALRDVCLEVKRGETIGFIGPNGSGKSTILKLLARIIYPTGGKIIVRGSVASLIEVGAGFHPELTGRENIFLYGSIMGMKRAEVREKFDRIVEFSEMEKFIDTPVKRYSSGMYVRLGFAVAAHINPAVLLVDEVLAVGDAAFQSKCQRRIEELRRGGMTIAFVSHDMPAVERLCDRVAFLHQGQLCAAGNPQAVISEYYNTVLFNKPAPAAPAANGRAAHQAGGPQAGREAEIVGVRFFNGAGEETDTVATGDPLTARIEYRVHQQLEDPVFELLFYSPDDRLYSHLTTAASGEPIQALPGHGVVEIRADECCLTPGIFKVDATLIKRGAIAPYDSKPRQYALKVMPGRSVRGMFYMPHRWQVMALS
jgi:ABC-type polysaccharide/polyol phosphate transport system ATPase subunit